MSDLNTGGPPPAAPPMGAGGDEARAVVEGNRSVLNKGDFMTMQGQMLEAGINENSTVREVLGTRGIDVDGPFWPQIQQFTDAMLGGADPLSQMDAIGAGENPMPSVPPAPGSAPPQPAPGMGGGLSPELESLLGGA